MSVRKGERSGCDLDRALLRKALSWNFLTSSGFAGESPRAPGSRAAAMAFKLTESAQTRWRAVNAPHLVALVRAGAVFKNGKLIERWLVSWWAILGSNQ